MCMTPIKLINHPPTHYACVLQCVGPSMLPTLQSRGDVLLHEKSSVQMGTIKVGALPSESHCPPSCGVCIAVLVLATYGVHRNGDGEMYNSVLSTDIEINRFTSDIIGCTGTALYYCAKNLLLLSCTRFPFSICLIRYQSTYQQPSLCVSFSPTYCT